MGEFYYKKTNLGEKSMKKSLVPFLLVLVTATMPAANEETFILKSHEFRISIEHQYQRNGLTPLVLFSEDLEIELVMDEVGRVFIDEVQARLSPMRPVFAIDPAAKTVAIGQVASPTRIEERDAVRTRLKLLRRDIPVFLKLNMEKVSGEIRLAETRLWLAVKAEETSPGVSLIRLISPNVQIMRDLYFLPSTGAIHQADPGMRALDPGACPVWAQRLNQGE
jgi:hypothetical protein